MTPAQRRSSWRLPLRRVVVRRVGNVSRRRGGIVVPGASSGTGRPPSPPADLRRALRAAVLASAGWASWRLARSGHWGAQLHQRGAAHRRYWEELAARQGEILYVAIGDSSAQGIGAREPSDSYVGCLERELDVRLQVVNLSITGARLSDLVTSVLPRLADLDLDLALVTFAAGMRDLEGFDAERFRSQLATIFDALPAHALVADLPSFPLGADQGRVREANAILHELADARGLTVVALFAATHRLGPGAVVTHRARDLFHPNDRGYRLWARTFLAPATARIDAIRNPPGASLAQVPPLHPSGAG